MGKLVAILLLFISISLDAQTVIVGKVIAHSGEPVNRVHIYCIESEKGTTTDSLGLFRLECSIPCTLEFSHVNYKKETLELRSYPLQITRSHQSPRKIHVSPSQLQTDTDTQTIRDLVRKRRLYHV